MAKGMYVGVGGKARKIKKAYVGIGGKARKIKKAYVGIGGKARLVWTSEPSGISSFQNLKSASAPDAYYKFVAVASNSQYLVAHMYHFRDTTGKGYTTAFNTQYVETSATQFGSYRSNMTGTIGNYSLIAGGERDSTDSKENQTYSQTSSVKAYNTSLTASSATLAGSYGYGTSGRIGNYLIFTPGLRQKWADYTDWLLAGDYTTAFNANLVKTTISITTNGGCRACAVTGNYLLIAGGKYDSTANESTSNVVSSSAVVALNSSLVKTTGTSLTAAGQVAGASNSNYAIFANDKIANAYNSSLTRSTISAPLDSYYTLSTFGCTIGNYAVFNGSQRYNSSLVKEVSGTSNTAYSYTIFNNKLFTCDCSNYYGSGGSAYIYGYDIV
jgi:hypothetical protein